jgi:hypothetical protein
MPFIEAPDCLLETPLLILENSATNFERSARPRLVEFTLPTNTGFQNS